jgi:hypothetical protein
MVMGPAGPETKNDFTGEDQQRFIRNPQPQPATEENSS